MMGRPRLLIFKVDKNSSNEYILRNPSTHERFRIAAHLCSQTKGCRNFITSTTPPYNGHWTPWQLPTPLPLPPWAPGYVPQPSDYDASLVSNCYNSYVKNYIIWQTALQKQKKNSLKSKYLIGRLIQMFVKRRSRMLKTIPPQPRNNYAELPGSTVNKYKPAYSHPAVIVQECVMAPAEPEQNSPVDLSRESIPAPSPYIEIPNFPTSTSFVKEETTYTRSSTEPRIVMTAAEQEQHFPVDLPNESYVDDDICSVPSPSLEETNSPASTIYASSEEPLFYEQAAFPMSPIVQEIKSPVDVTNYIDDDDYNLTSPAMEVTVNDRINNEDAANHPLVERGEEIPRTPEIGVIFKMEMARKM